MNTLEPRMPELALLRELPPEVSLAQVEQWVALFPAAPPPKPWYRNINLNTIIMTTASTLLVGGLLYFLSTEPTTPPPASQALPPPAPAIESAPAPSTASEPSASLAPATAPPARISPAPSADPASDTPVAAVPPAPAASTPVQLPAPSAGPSPAPSATPRPAPTPSIAAAPTSTSETERRFDLTGFEKVTLLGSLHVELHQGPFSVVAIGPTEELEYVEATVKGGALTIRQKDHREVQAEGHPKRRTKVYLGPVAIAKIPGGSGFSTRVVVHMPDLAAFDLDGSGAAVVHGFNRQENVAIRVAGSGDLLMQASQDIGELRLELQGSGIIRCTDVAVKGKTTLRLAGSGDMEVSGRTTELDLVLMGSGIVQAGAFAAERGSAEVIGSGDAKVNFTTDQVSTKVMGSGNLKRVGR